MPKAARAARRCIFRPRSRPLRSTSIEAVTCRVKRRSFGSSAKDGLLVEEVVNESFGVPVGESALAVEGVSATAGTVDVGRSEDSLAIVVVVPSKVCGMVHFVA